MDMKSKMAEFVVAINFDIDGLASVIAEQHNDTVVDLFRLVMDMKNDSDFNIKLSQIL